MRAAPLPRRLAAVHGPSPNHAGQDALTTDHSGSWFVQRKGVEGQRAPRGLWSHARWAMGLARCEAVAARFLDARRSRLARFRASAAKNR
jgi:hypothetical protein